MTTQISSREWEALSAYLDNQLDQRERARLEKRLQEDASLRAALEGLQRTRAFLRAQPELRAPRSFTLSPEMAGLRQGMRPEARRGARRMARPMPPAYPTLRLAFALATLFFVVVLFGDLAVQRMQPLGQVALSQKELVAPEAPVQGMGGGGGGVGSEGVQPPAQPAPFFLPTEAAALEKAYASPSEVPDTQVLVVTPAHAADLATTAPLLEASPQEQPPMALQPAEGLAPVDVPERNEAPGAVLSSFSWSFLRLFQILLGLLVVVSGLALLYLRRARRE